MFSKLPVDSRSEEMLPLNAVYSKVTSGTIKSVCFDSIAFKTSNRYQSMMEKSWRKKLQPQNISNVQQLTE
jgi:hypothetical protein